MRKIIILEGIATSGKTSVINQLEKMLLQNGRSFAFIGEEETLLPLLQNNDAQIADKHIAGILNKYLSMNKDVLVFDRLFLTHVWRTGGHVGDFTQSSSLLLDNNSLVCFLEIPEAKVEERISLAQSHRDEKWNSYVNTKGKNQQEIVTYYSNQQKSLLDLLKVLPVPSKIFDTGDMNFEKIAREISLSI